MIYTKNAHAAMMVASSKEGVGFVGGTLGGFIFPDFFFAVDGMYSAAKILEMRARIGVPLVELAKELPKRYQARGSAFCPQDQLGTVMRRAVEHSKDFPRILIDGIRFSPIANSDAWVLLIPERERPYCEILSDADSPEVAESIAASYSTYVQQWRK